MGLTQPLCNLHLFHSESFLQHSIRLSCTANILASGCTLPPYAHLYLMIHLHWVQGRVTTNYKKGYNILLQNDNWYFNRGQWITARTPIKESNMSVLRLRCSFLEISTSHSSALYIVWTEKVLLLRVIPDSSGSCLLKEVQLLIAPVIYMNKSGSLEQCYPPINLYLDDITLFILIIF